MTRDQAIKAKRKGTRVVWIHPRDSYRQATGLIEDVTPRFAYVRYDRSLMGRQLTSLRNLHVWKGYT